MTSILKSNWASKKKAKNDAIESGDLENEKKVLIKWQDYYIETRIAIHGEMDLQNRQKNKVCNNLFEWKLEKYKKSYSYWPNWTFWKALAWICRVDEKHIKD